MHFHSIIVAALSAGALSVSLTAKDLTDSDNQPNTKCTGKNNGNDVGIEPSDCPQDQPDCTCFLYEPPNGSYIWIDYVDYFGDLYEIDVFSDTNCQKPLTTVVPSKEVISADAYTECVFMGDGVHWGSVMMGDVYQGNGANFAVG